MKLFSFRFECKKCGNCCKNLLDGIPLYVRDVRRISSFLKLDVNEFIKQYCGQILYKFNMDNGLLTVPVVCLQPCEEVCPFLVGNHCTIHLVKPYVCSAAPFTSLLFQDKVWISFFKQGCKGFGKGKMHSLDEIRQQLKEEVILEKEDLIEYQSGFYKKINNILKKEENHDTRSTSKRTTIRIVEASNDY